MTEDGAAAINAEPIVQRPLRQIGRGDTGLPARIGFLVNLARSHRIAGKVEGRRAAQIAVDAELGNLLPQDFRWASLERRQAVIGRCPADHPCQLRQRLVDLELDERGGRGGRALQRAAPVDADHRQALRGQRLGHHGAADAHADDGDVGLDVAAELAGGHARRAVGEPDPAGRF